jgi:hypothetical protein
MKSKQLANVLIKVLGLSVGVRAIPGFISGILSAFISIGVSRGEVTFMRILSSALGAGIEAAIGIFLIVNSRKITDYLFKDEED